MRSPEQAGQSFRIEDPEDLNVFALYYPFKEVVNARQDISLSEDFHNPLLKANQATDLLRSSGYSFWHDLEIPTTARGLVNFEKIHEPVTAHITEHIALRLPGLRDFEKRYATHGAGEAITRLMAGWFATRKMTQLGYVEGDYPGYIGEAYGLGVPLHPVNSLEEAGAPVEGRVWFLSNPSAIDGNWLDNEVFQQFIEAGHDVVLDYAYGGLVADEHSVDVSAPNIKAVLTSPSKTFGVFNHRLTGVAYTRQEEGSLGSTEWYKSIPNLFDTLELYERFTPHELPRIYARQQRVICDALAQLVGAEIEPSDNILMAHSQDVLSDRYSMFASSPGKYRFRLSTLFKRLELHTQKQESN